MNAGDMDNLHILGNLLENGFQVAFYGPPEHIGVIVDNLAGPVFLRSHTSHSGNPDMLPLIIRWLIQDKSPLQWFISFENTPRGINKTVVGNDTTRARWYSILAAMMSASLRTNNVVMSFAQPPLLQNTSIGHRPPYRS